MSNRICSYGRPIFFLLLLISLCYGHTLDAAWHLDDIPNILSNSKIHVTQLSKESVLSSLYASPKSQALYRPAAMLSFALNWYFGRDNVFGYHLVNIFIHMTVAVFLFLTLTKLFSAFHLKFVNKENVFFIALLSSVLWALHPIQTQAVTYIVQRMASLAALFYIISVWAYISGRLSNIPQIRILWFTICFLAYGLAYSTKANTILLPVILLLLEFCFFQDWNLSRTKFYFWGIVIAGFFIVLTLIIYVLSGGEISYWLSKYQVRPFTLQERLLTQFRVMVFYLSQIAYPVPSQLSITHDYSLSTSILSPWTTLPSIMFVLGLIGIAVWSIPKSPGLKIVGFAILFFFINHIVESTIIPLEMIFEHRNYLPSLFLFVPVAFGINYVLNIYQRKNKFMYIFLIAATSAFMIGFGLSTYNRNMDWRSEKSLWTDAMRKAPNSARPLQNLAYGYYSPAGQYEKSLTLYFRALDLNEENIGFEAISYYNIANIYYNHLNHYEKALAYAEKALYLQPEYENAKALKISSLIHLGANEQALKLLDSLCLDQPQNERYMYLKGLLLLNDSNPKQALEIFRKCLQISPQNWKYFREIGFCFSLFPESDMTYWFFCQAYAFNPNQPELLLGLAENRLKKKSKTEAERYLNYFIDIVEPENVLPYFRNAIDQKLFFPIDFKLLIPYIARRIEFLSDNYNDFSEQLRQMTAVDNLSNSHRGQ